MNIRAKTTLENTQDMIDQGEQVAHNVIARTAHQADELIAGAQQVAAEADRGLDQLREDTHGTHGSLTRVAERAEDMARTGIEKARLAGSAVADKASEVGTQTTRYVRREPAKALLMAAAAGAAATLVVSWATNRRSDSPAQR